MKTFNDLTKEQQNAAVKFAYEQLHESVKIGILEVKGDLHTLAQEAAEGSHYTDDGKSIMEPMDVPFYFQGGCV